MTEAIFNEHEGISEMGAGTHKDAETTVCRDLIEWADITFAMEKSHIVESDAIDY